MCAKKTKSACAPFHHGIRSLNVARYLAHVGFEHVANLQGGIDAWARQIDPTMARY